MAHHEGKPGYMTPACEIVSPFINRLRFACLVVGNANRLYRRHSDPQFGDLPDQEEPGLTAACLMARPFISQPDTRLRLRNTRRPYLPIQVSLWRLGIIAAGEILAMKASSLPPKAGCKGLAVGKFVEKV